MKKLLMISMIAILAAALAACGSKADTAALKAETTESTATAASSEPAENKAEGDTRVIQYLGQDYTVPAKVERIAITGSVESMEDALVLNVEPVGAMTQGGKFADLFQSITSKSESTGEKIQLNFESILKMKPDVILSSSKFKPEVGEKLSKIAPTFPISHLSENWDANLRLLAELTGKQDEAEKILKQYQDELETTKGKIQSTLKDKKVVALRVRAGNLMLYSDKVFFNPLLYTDLGFTVPAEVKAAKGQENLSLEKLSEMNPDYVILQYSESENKATPAVMKDIEGNPIWKNLKAVKDNQVFVNLIDPDAQGGTAWSKINFLKALAEKLN
ncbi:ABC transporter substrate-binding protein [Paenibacillus guangzhouensis]|uniref:ABC transporter substrate-binding protein n=1 Tax=Paenibacillus guangzhouensis TaxID=1473112 RepID=UPI001266E817|nr:ABC transporter substrate-binding protein [Paenibacillus guangzhouensis]